MVKVYLRLHYADVRAPECTGQASGGQVVVLGGAGVRASAESRGLTGGWVAWLVAWQRTRVGPLSGCQAAAGQTAEPEPSGGPCPTRSPLCPLLARWEAAGGVWLVPL